MSSPGYASVAYGLVRFGLGLKAFLRSPISLDRARAIIHRRMETRADAFLVLLERAVFANPRSPYLRLFRSAGCGLEDVRAVVRQNGVDRTLGRLRDAGVYVTFAEFKGRTPAVRGGETFQFRNADFDNPQITPHYHTSSGGSRGSPSRILIDLEYLSDRAALWCVWFAAHDLLASPLVFLTPYYPGIINLQLICAKFGTRFVKWFATARGGSLAYRLVSAYLHTLMRRVDGSPKPEFLGPGGAGRVGAYLTTLTRAGLRPAVNASPSDAIRVCLETRARGLSLEGVTFLLGYEPLTGARRQTIEAAGARAAMTYGFSEAGTVGQQCRSPAAPDDVHVAADAFAVIEAARSGPEPLAKPLLLTTLSLTTPKVMLNAEIGDAAILETRRCGCVLDDLGYLQHLHTIRSLEKLTGMGVTFHSADVFRLLEESLPQKFGGTLADYQLVECQDARGLPQVSLLVSPGIGDVNEGELVAHFLDQLGRVRPHYRFMVDQWIQGDVLRVIREFPRPTAHGKILPVRTLGPR